MQCRQSGDLRLRSGLQGMGARVCNKAENGGLAHSERTMTRPEKWKELCAQAEVEQDPQRLLELVQQINEIFERKDMEKKRQAERKSQ
jgi:hypothetical protein